MLLNDIGLKYNADKSSRFHNYLDFYEKHLPDREFSGRLLEIGVMDGLSMRMWAEYYPKAEIVGIDIKPDMASYMHNEHWQVPERVKLLTLDGTKKADMQPLGMFDIIIDDGSHYWAEQQKSFEILYYSQLNKGGVYILEDLWTSHIEFYNNAKINTLDYLKKLEKKGMKMIYFKYKHKGLGIQTVFPEYKGLDSETVVIKAGQLK
jgi:spermidine synthase